MAIRHPLAIAVALLVPCLAAASPRLEAPFAHTAGLEVPVRGALAIDLDGDGRLDLVGCHVEQDVATLQVLADVAWLPEQSLDGRLLTLASAAVDAPRPAVADMDGDGRADVLLGGGGGMMIVRQRAGLEFDPPLIWNTGTAGDHVACDLDGDALPDLVAASAAISFVRNLSGGGGTPVLLSGVRIREVGGELLLREDLVGVAPAPTVAYRLEAVGENGGLGWYGPYRHAWPASLLAAGLELSCPSPLRGAGRILYATGRPGPARLRVYDPRGRLVRELFHGPLAAGRHEALWGGADARGTPVASGVYLLRLEQGSRFRLRKAILLR